MKIEYENWAELADDLCDGEKIAHRVTFFHAADDCNGWMKGIHNLCDLLDAADVPVPNHDAIWDAVNGLPKKVVAA